MADEEKTAIWRSAAFDPMDRALGDLMARLDPSRPLVALAAALASRARGLGHVCWTLGVEPVLKVEGEEIQEYKLPSKLEWSAAFAGSKLLGRPGDYTPLILDSEGRIYLHQLHATEGKLAVAIAGRAAMPSTSFNASALETFLGLLIAGNSLKQKQREAVTVACGRTLTVLTGGPGTGKTHTAVRLVAAGIRLGLVQAERIRVAAPTGKAAARLQEKLEMELGDLVGDAALAAAVPKAGTLHRLLGASADGTRFSRNRENPVEADWILVDEVSMVGMEMMSRLFEATIPAKKVILIGDPNQLESVEAGAVLAELVRAGDVGGVLAGGVVALEENQRVELGALGLLALASMVNAGDGVEVSRILAQSVWPEVSLKSLREPKELSELISATVEQFVRAKSAPTAEMALAEYGRSKVLCALRIGPTGSLQFNRLVEEKLRLERIAGSHWFHGQPVIVTRNNYSLSLFNGDLGVVWRVGNELAVMFPGAGGELRSVAVSRLPEYETAFALTVHKAQGSEFDRVDFLLPFEDSPVLSRELVYTAVSRARVGLKIWGSEEVLVGAVVRQSQRHSGFGTRLAASRGN